MTVFVVSFMKMMKWLVSVFRLSLFPVSHLLSCFPPYKLNFNFSVPAWRKCRKGQNQLQSSYSVCLTVSLTLSLFVCRLQVEYEPEERVQETVRQWPTAGDEAEGKWCLSLSVSNLDCDCILMFGTSSIRGIYTLKLTAATQRNVSFSFPYLFNFPFPISFSRL